MPLKHLYFVHITTLFFIIWAQSIELNYRLVLTSVHIFRALIQHRHI